MAGKKGIWSARAIGRIRAGEMVAAVGSSHARSLKARPTCAVCGKLVESFTEEEGFLDKFVVFTARCHGAAERVRISLEDLDDSRIDFGLAFVSKNQIAEPRVRGLLPPKGDPDGVL